MPLVFEILREGGIRLPQPVGQAISIVGAIVLGDAAVSANLVSAPMIVVVAVTSVAGFVVSPLYEAAVLFRFILIFCAAFLGLYGYFLGIMAIVLHLAFIKSFTIPYLSSLASFTAQDSKDTIIRVPWWQMTLRPRHLARSNRRRLKNSGGEN